MGDIHNGIDCTYVFEWLSNDVEEEVLWKKRTHIHLAIGITKMYFQQDSGKRESKGKSESLNQSDFCN